MKEHRRRASWIDPRYQMKQAFISAGANLLVALMMAGLMSWFYLLVFQAPLGIDHNWWCPFIVAGAIVLIIIASALLSFRRSRAMAGMLRKIGLVMNGATEGRFPGRPLVFRKDDYSAGLAEPLNRCLVKMKKDMQEREELAAQLHEISQGLRKKTATPEMAANRVEEIIAAVQGETAHEN